MRLTEDQYAALPNAEKEGRRPIPPHMRRDDWWTTAASEKEFQALVVECAKLRGWRHYHTHDSRRSPSGFPDLVLVRDRVLYRELKTERGKVSKDQKEWIGALNAARQDAKVWRPKDWNEILTELF